MSMFAFKFSRAITATAALALIPMVAAAQQIPHQIANIPAHFMIPKNKWAPLENTTSLLTITNAQIPSVGYRLIPFGPSAADRRTSAKKLAELGLVKDGDVLLSFRPEWVGTAAYANIQMGISHTGLALIRNGMVHSVETPLNYSSNLDSDHHYSNAEMPLRAMHIFRPKMSDQERTNMRGWLERLLSQGPSKISFDKDYNAPEYATGYAGNVNKMIKNVGDIALKKGNSVSMYCSEFAYAVLGLRKCDPSSLSDSCISPLYPPLALIGTAGEAGLTDGPNLVLKAAGLNDQDRKDYLQKNVLVSTLNVNNMSSGHQAVMKSFLPLVGQLAAFHFQFGEAPQAAMQINMGAAAQMGLQNNYSPTSFVVKALDDDNQLEYVATVLYN